MAHFLIYLSFISTYFKENIFLNNIINTEISEHTFGIVYLKKNHNLTFILMNFISFDGKLAYNNNDIITFVRLVFSIMQSALFLLTRFGLPRFTTHSVLRPYLVLTSQYRTIYRSIGKRLKQKNPYILLV